MPKQKDGDRERRETAPKRQREWCRKSGMETREGDREGQEADTEGAGGQGGGEPALPQATLQLLCPGLGQREPPFPLPLALAPLSHPPPSKACQPDTPSWGVVEPGSLGHLRQTGRVPGAVLLGERAQGPSLSPEPLLGWGLALTWGLTWGPGRPSSHSSQPWQPSALHPLGHCAVSKEVVKTEAAYTW